MTIAIFDPNYFFEQVFKATSLQTSILNMGLFSDCNIASRVLYFKYCIWRFNGYKLLSAVYRQDFLNKVEGVKGEWGGGYKKT